MHIHTHIGKIDHYPLSINDIERKFTIKILDKICNKSENKNVVMEYALDYIDGKNIEEKIKNYIKEAELISTNT